MLVVFAQGVSVQGVYMSQGVIVLGGKCPRGKCPEGICPWGKCPGGTCLGGLCPRTDFDHCKTANMNLPKDINIQRTNQFRI